MIPHSLLWLPETRPDIPLHRVWREGVLVTAVRASVDYADHVQRLSRLTLLYDPARTQSNGVSGIHHLMLSSDDQCGDKSGYAQVMQTGMHSRPSVHDLPSYAGEQAPASRDMLVPACRPGPCSRRAHTASRDRPLYLSASIRSNAIRA
jgi:hypothetical protein